MDFIEKVIQLQKKANTVGQSLLTEEATKNALVMPFLHNILGYDVFDPTEVIPEFTADTGIKKGEKVDYALVKDNVVQILIECKKFGENLSTKHSGQLFRYFSVTNARIAILTNGTLYQFYTDLDQANRMDEKPFLTLDLLNIDEHIIPEVKKLTKQSFDIESILDAAGELKHMNAIKNILNQQFSCPDEEFVKFFASRVYSGILTPKVKIQFQEIVKKSLKQFLNDNINSRLKSAISEDARQSNSTNNEDQENDIKLGSDILTKIITTDEELEGFNIIKAILRQKISTLRISSRDTQSYFGILLDDNNRKPLARLHFNGRQKYLGIFDKDKQESKIPIDSLEDIFMHSDSLLTSLSFYEQPQ